MNQLINVESVREYIKEKNLFPGQNTDVHLVDIGNINYVYEIITKDNLYFLKFYSDSPRKPTEAIDKIGISPYRFERESGSIRYMKDIFDDDVAICVPEIFHSDEKGKVLIMEDISKKGTILKELLLSDFDLKKTSDILDIVANMTAQLHVRTLRNGDYKERVKDEAEVNKRFYDFRTYFSCEKLNEEQKEIIRKKSEELYEENKKFFCLINADLSPKHIFIWPGFKGMGLCDFEFMGDGMASYDVGFFVSNIYVIKIIREDYQKELDSLMDGFVKAYLSYLDKEGADKEFVQFTKNNISFFVGMGILNRIDAVPLEPHIPESRVDELRKTAVDFIFNGRSIYK